MKVFPGLVTIVCPLPNVPIDSVPGMGVSGLLVVVPGTVPPVVPEVPGVEALVSPVCPTTTVVVPGDRSTIGLLGLVTVDCPLLNVPTEFVPGMEFVCRAGAVAVFRRGVQKNRFDISCRSTVGRFGRLLRTQLPSLIERRRRRIQQAY